MNPDRENFDPAYLLACLVALVVIGGFSLLAGLIADQDSRPHHPETVVPSSYVCQRQPSSVPGEWEIDAYSDTQGLDPTRIVPCP